MYSNIEHLASWKEGNVVEVDDGVIGVITGKMTSGFTWKVGGEENKIDASSSNPIYIVARSGKIRSNLYEEDELSEGSFDDDGDEPKVKELANKGEMASIYWEVNDVNNINQIEQLLNVPGADDPEVGFAKLPPGWDRTSVLRAWASLGGTWTTCRTQMVGDIRSPERFCAALKDEVLGTENWRNRF